MRLQCLQERLIPSNASFGGRVGVVELKKSSVPAFEHESIASLRIFRKIKIDAERLPTKIIFWMIGLRFLV